MMSRRRFYAAPEEFDGSVIRLSSDETHHLARVLRLRVTDEVFAFDGCGREYRCRVSSIEKRARLEIIEELSGEVESPVHITLAQAMAKGEKFDLITQKATELGVSRIIPLATDQADVKLEEESAAKRLERWRRISLESLKQCGRRKLVEIISPVALEVFVKSNASSSMIVFSEKGGQSIDAALDDAIDRSSVIALVGPEGGWSDEELKMMEDIGCRLVTLGPRVLRAETAAIAAVALIQHALGDLSV